MSTQYPPPVYYSSKPRQTLSPMDIGILVLILLGCVGCVLIFAFYMVLDGNLTPNPQPCATNEFGSPIIINGCTTQVYGGQSLIEMLPTATSLPPSVLPPLLPTAVPATATPVCYLRIDLPAYTVSPGDTVSSIAQATGSTTEDIAAWNCMGDIDRISIGQVLYVRMLPSAILPAFAPSGMLLVGNNQYGTRVNVCQGNQVAIQFTSQTTNVERYVWGFGDGTTSMEPNPQHTFIINRSGATSFNVTLTAYGWDGIPRTTTTTLTFNAHCP